MALRCTAGIVCLAYSYSEKNTSPPRRVCVSKGIARTWRCHVTYLTALLLELYLFFTTQVLESQTGTGRQAQHATGNSHGLPPLTILYSSPKPHATPTALRC